MSNITFTWDEGKNRSNLKKHGVSFEEGKTVFADEYARLIPDPDHSQDEERFLLLGVSHGIRLLLICHCYLEEDDVVRIVSARKADKRETKQYLGFRNA